MPVIYLICKSPCIFSVLPSIGVSRAGNPQTMVYMNLQPPVSTALTVARSLVVSYTAFSPLPCFVCYTTEALAVVFFCSNLLSPATSIFGSGAPCAARTFLLYIIYI